MNVKYFALGGLAGGAVLAVLTTLAPPPQQTASVAPAVEPSPVAPIAPAPVSPSPISSDELERDYPWLKPSPGVVYVKPRRAPAQLHAEYEAFDETLEAARAGAGQFEQGGYRILSGSLELGLRPGDKIISINGQPVSPANLHEALFPGGSTLAVLVERDGEEVELTFSTDD